MLPPKRPDRLPSLSHNGQDITVIRHYGFSSNGAARMLYGAKDGNGERHWRRSFDEITHFLDRSNDPSSPSS